MSGNVDRTVEAAEVARAACGVTIGLTNSAGGRLAELGLPNISLELPDLAKFLCGTSSFLATRALLRLVAGSAQSVPLAALAQQVSATADALEALLPHAEEAVLAACEGAGDVPGLRYLSCGPAGMAIAEYGAAKIVELAGTPVWFDDVEEFAHRQYWTMARGERAVMLPTSPKVAGIAAASAEALRAMGVRTLAAAPRDMAPRGDWAIDWPASEGADDLALAAAVTQLFAYRWAQATGFDPNRRMHLKEDTERFRTSRQLTRRSLLALAGDAATAV
jgi:fructoselysine-6-P-deglycase FrlB-like protein